MKREDGFSILELILATAVIGVIASVLGTVVYQIFMVTEYGNARLTAVHELQNVAHWVSLDVQGARAADFSDGLVLTLSDNTEVRYSLAGTELSRTAGGLTMILARNISDAGFSAEDGAIITLITSSPLDRDEVSEEGTYRVYLRLAGE